MCDKMVVIIVIIIRRFRWRISCVSRCYTEIDYNAIFLKVNIKWSTVVLYGDTENVKSASEPSGSPHDIRFAFLPILSGTAGE